MSWVTKERDKYVPVACVTGDIYPETNSIRSFIIHEGNTKLLKYLIDELLKEIDNPMLVEINIEDNKSYESGEKRYGGQLRYPSFYVNIDVFSEDVRKINSKTPVRMRVSTNVYRNDKDLFIKFFNNFSKVLGY